MVVLEGSGVGVKATQEKWNKTKHQLLHIEQLLSQGGPLDRKLLESYRGSLVYLQRTYPSITPYVKGFHLTIDGWREDRNAEGWKIPNYQRSGGDNQSPPATVSPVPRLSSDVKALLQLFDAAEPPVRWVRGHKITEVVYSFGDASGSGYGRTFSDQDQVGYAHGVWDATMMAQSSNYRELSNLVQSLEEGVRNGQLLHSEIWIFTDNSTSEGVFWKGHSPSPLLNDLALRLRLLEMEGTVRIQMVHVPGTRMISQGTDGLSRGDFTEGVMAGQTMLQHVPLRLNALERQPGLLRWIASWVPSPPVVLSPELWGTTGHGTCGGAEDMFGMWQSKLHPADWFLWAPPPALGDVAVEELEISRHKRNNLSHIFLCPRLMTYAWRKRLIKICDAVLSIPPGSRTFWPATEHEPLILGLTLRFSPCSPWQVKRCSQFLALAGELQGMWSRPEDDERDILRKLCLGPEWVGSV
jgi:hypothetical protein